MTRVLCAWFGAGRPVPNERAVANPNALPQTGGRTLIGPRRHATDFFGLGQNASPGRSWTVRSVPRGRPC